MFNLKLFTQLQGDNVASLLLRPGQPGYIQFFIMSTSVNHSIVVSGQCEGELPSMTPISFDVMLKSIAPLLDKNYNFRLQYLQGHLTFVEVNDKFVVEPLCVEHIPDFVVSLTKKYMEFIDQLGQLDSVEKQLKELQAELQDAKVREERAALLDASGFVNENPWSEPKENAGVQRLHSRVVELESEISDLESKSIVRRQSLSDLRRIANIGSRYNTIVSMCGDYAIVDLKTVFILQKVDCGLRAVQAKLLQRLLAESEGDFFEFDGELVFCVRSGKGVDATNIVIFLQPYLPNTTVDKTIVTKGAVQEKYHINLGPILRVVSTVSSRFDIMEFDMGAGRVRLSNDNGESLVHKFEAKEAKTIELNKMMRGEQCGNIVMSTISVPRTVQKIIGYLQEDFTIYVKARKVILQSGSLYVVFAR